ncbi:MAG: NIF family HAD-type phosphatase [Pseudomonadota bacterium]|nr:NIF family HAD-type phosphatase [Pseudomonadota bacterium]MDP1903972.1 NIF family HAD-type phosphatase [Pseudomonadota bacterium]MDP2354074.1 NIF family HAD-type phosphatase [Pseudomonadota bacterium]
MTKIKVIALDLEGTLISNAMSQFPRPGLYAFLEACRGRVERVVMFTTVKESVFRPIADLLVAEGHAPSWFRDIEFVTWEGATKNLDWIPGVQPEEALLVDDFEIYVHPGQEAQWLRAPFFDWPYPDDDTGLGIVLEMILNCTERRPGSTCGVE